VRLRRSEREKAGRQAAARAGGGGSADQGTGNTERRLTPRAAASAHADALARGGPETPGLPDGERRPLRPRADPPSGSADDPSR